MKKHLKLQGWFLLVLALALSLNAAAQSAENYYGPTTSSGQLSHGVGTGVQAFSILTGGSFDGFTNGVSVDNFVGPNALPGAQEIGGVVAPIFDSLKLNNGARQAFNITNTAGIIVNGAVVYNNGITTTLRTNRIAGLAGAVQFLGNAIYSPALVPAAGTDTVFTDGFVSKVNPVRFVFPVGNVTDLRPVTATGTGTFATAWSNSNVASFYNTASLPPGTLGIATNGYWEWSGTAAATVTLSIPNESTFTTANKLSVLAYNGTAWTNLGGNFTTNTENSVNTTAVSVPPTTVALAIGNTSPAVLVSPAVYLMGAMSSAATMTQYLRTFNLIPKAQPYSAAPFNYAGTELLTTLPINMVDWILVDVRDSVTPATKIIATRAAILNIDGTVTDLDGISPITFSNVTAGNYYIGFRHRNHLAIRSAALQALSTTTDSIDFRTIATNAYTNIANTVNSPMRSMGNGRYAMWGGNGNGNSTVRVTGTAPVNDYLYLVNFSLQGVISKVLTNVYNNGDYNMNGTVRATGTNIVNDYLYLLNGVLGGVSSKVLTQHL